MSFENFAKEGLDPTHNPIKRRLRLSQRGRSMFPMGSLSLLLMFLLAIFLNLLSPVEAEMTPEELAQVKEFLKTYNSDEEQFTYFQLKQWFDDQMTKKNVAIPPELYPRLFPFCVTYEQVINHTHLTRPDSKLSYYKNIFLRIKQFHDVNEKFYHFDENKHTSTKNTDFIKSIHFNRINTPEPDMINMRQWAHITVKTIPLQGLYLQPIVGPLGIPVGEFSLEFPCKDVQSAQNMLDVGELGYCHYRPKASTYHPKIYVAYTQSPTKNFHVHYKWADITCYEAPYLQFLIIAVKEFTANPTNGVDYQIIYSDVFLNTGQDSDDGSPYPYHPIWRYEMLCGADSGEYVQGHVPGYRSKNKQNADIEFAPILWQSAADQGIFRVQPNEEYDACITGSRRPDILAKKDDTRLECPPGPFRCTESNQDKSKEDILAARQVLIQNEVKMREKKCYPCAAPTCLESGFSEGACGGVVEEEIVVINDTSVMGNMEVIARSKSHGTLASLATLVLIPLANHIARFYKDACNSCMCRNGPWIFVHIVFHGAGSIVLWISIGPVIAAISNYEQVLNECRALHSSESAAATCATEKSLGNPHIPLGILVFLFQNLMIVLGFCRSSSDKIRGIQVWIHSVVGYLTYIFACLAAIVAVFNNRCLEIVILMGILIAVPFAFIILSIVVECISDKKIGIKPARKQIPVLEPIKLNKRGPCGCMKWFIFFFFIIIIFILWFLVAASSNYSAKLNNPDAFDPDDPTNSLATTFAGNQSRLRGLFSGVCGWISNEDSNYDEDDNTTTTTTPAPKNTATAAPVETEP